MATISVSLPSDGSTADVADYNTPITTIVNEINGNLDNANIKAGAAIAGSKLADNSIDLEAKASSDSGWRGVTDSWAYASATTITVPTDATTKYSVGDKIKLVQSGTTKYFYIVTVAATLLTITGGTDYTLANVAISSVYYSKAASPLGFPQWFAYTPTWTNLTATSSTQTSAFSMVGKNIVVRLNLVWGASTAITGDVTFTLPVTSKNSYTNFQSLGSVALNDASGLLYTGMIAWATTTTAHLYPQKADSTYANFAAASSTVPFTWTTSDGILGTFMYEAA